MQDFINGVDFKEDMRKLAAHFLALPEDVRKTGMFKYASVPPMDDSLITVRLWDKYLPGWRAFTTQPKVPSDPAQNARIVENIKRMSESPELKQAEIPDLDTADYISLQRAIKPRKGSFQRMSDEQIKTSTESRRND